MENFIRLNSEEFRRKLAFPLGDETVSEDAASKAKDWLVDLCAVLPRFYSDALDRTNLWGRIESALSVASSRCARADEIPDALLAHIDADPVRVAASAELMDFFNSAGDQDLQAIKRIIATRRLFVICKARAIWMEGK